MSIASLQERPEIATFTHLFGFDGRDGIAFASTAGGTEHVLHTFKSGSRRSAGANGDGTIFSLKP
jgi:hypothetical protein